MRLYNKNKDRIENNSIIKTKHANFYVDKLTEDELNKHNYYHIESGSPKDRKLYRNNQIKILVGNKYKISYESIEIDKIKNNIVNIVVDDNNTIEPETKINML